MMPRKYVFAMSLVVLVVSASVGYFIGYGTGYGQGFRDNTPRIEVEPNRAFITYCKAAPCDSGTLVTYIVGGGECWMTEYTNETFVWRNCTANSGEWGVP